MEWGVAKMCKESDATHSCTLHRGSLSSMLSTRMPIFASYLACVFPGAIAMVFSSYMTFCRMQHG